MMNLDLLLLRKILTDLFIGLFEIDRPTSLSSEKLLSHIGIPVYAWVDTIFLAGMYTSPILPSNIFCNF